ncbi:hypothetical protein [Streptomyces sp. Midd1]|uniref:hypothetical protein n=1 Tax=Streptomyces sp. Midd3 TaxID=3161191 RepID=UPI0034DAC158
MMMLRFPRGFVPEEHGWRVTNPVVPHQQREMAMYELHRFGFVSTHYMRWHLPYRTPATLAVMGYRAESDQFWGMYGPPFERPDEEVTMGRVVDEILHGFDSPARPFVSLPVK